MRKNNSYSALLKRLFCIFFSSNYIGFIVAVSLPLLSNAQPNPEKGLPFVTNFYPKTYKAYPQSWSIVEDNKGLMYFGSQGYILQYDGIKWQKINCARSGTVAVRSLAKNKKGTIYYAAISDFGYIAPDSLGQMKAYSLLKHVPASLRNFNDVWSVYATDEGIYFQARERIFRLTEDSSGRPTGELKSWEPKTNFMYAFYLDGTYYVHQLGQGLFKMVNDSLELIPGSEFLGKERMQVMLPYNEDNSRREYLLGMFYGGLCIYDGKTFRHFAVEADSLLKATLYKATLLKDGSYALATAGKGLVIMDKAGKTLQVINRAAGLQDESVYSVYPDSQGNVWLGLDNGISRIETASPLTQFTIQSGITTASLCIQRFDGAIYLGTTNGLLRFNNNTAHFESIKDIFTNQVFAFLENNGQMLVATDGLFSEKDKKANVIHPSISGNMQLAALYISKKNPDILFAGESIHGVAVFTKTNLEDKPSGWHFAGYFPGLNQQVWTFAEDNNGTLWGGTQNEVVCRIHLGFDDKGKLDLSKSSAEKFGKENGLGSGCGPAYLINGKVYFTADSAIYRFDQNQERFFKDSTFGTFKNAGGKDEAYMTEDYAGRVWIRFGKESEIAIPQPDGSYKIDKTALLPISDRTISQFYAEKNGTVWICTTDGLVRFDENLKKNYDEPFNTLLRTITAGNQILNPDVDVNNQKDISIGSANNSLRFEYAAPFFEQEDKMQYQTWLEGFEKDWSGWGNNYYKEYTNLAGGDYKFHVRAKNIYQKVSDEAVYDFTISPPWYQTWWAYLLYALLAIAIVYLLVRYRTHQLHVKHRELEKTVSERTGELSQRVQELAVINGVQEALVSALGIQEIYDLVGNRLRDVFSAQAVIIATLDQETGLENFKFTIENGQRFYPDARPFDKLRRHLIKTRQKIVINNSAEAFTWFGTEAIAGTKPMKSGVFVPLVIGDKITSYVSLQNVDKENAFSESNIKLLETLANSMSVALENARLFDETQRLLKETEQRNAELGVINSVQESLVAQMNMDAIYHLVGEKMREIFNAQVIDIVTYDKKANIIEDRYAYEKGDRTLIGHREPNGFRKHVIESRQLLLINENMEQAMHVFSNAIMHGEFSKSAVYVPMIAGGDVTGIVSLQNLDKEHAFSESDVSLLTTLVNSMSVALQNARLFDETNRLLKETEQRTAELALINSVQEGLVREMDIQSIYDLVGDRVQKLFQAQTVVIASFNFKNKTEQFNYVFENNKKYNFEPRPINKLRQLLIEKKQTIYIETEEKAKNEYGIMAIEDSEMPKSLLFVPLLSGKEIKGYISLQNIDTEHAFSQSDISLSETLINSMSVALENARLFDETKILLAETEKGKKNVELLSDIGKEITASLDFETIFYKLYDHINQLADATIFGVGIYQPEQHQIEYKFAIEKGKRYAPYARSTTDKNQFPVWCIENRQPVFINDVKKEYSRYIPHYAEKPLLLEDGSYAKDAESIIYLPLIVQQRIFGIITIQSFEKNAYTEYHLNLLQNLATYTSIALDNANAYRQLNEREQEIGQRVAELSTVNSISRALASQLDVGQLINFVGEQVHQLFQANISYVALLDKKTKTINFLYQNGENMPQRKLGEGFTSKIILSGKPLLINKEITLKSQELGVNRIGVPAASYLGVPIPVGDEIIGVLSVQSTEQENRFSEKDQRLLTTIAAHVGVALRKARLFEEVKQANLEADAARKTAEQANAAKSAFLSTVSHELRTPLTSVLGFAKIIKKRLEEKIFPTINSVDSKINKTAQQISENLDVVIAEGQRLTNLINDVLDLAKIEAGKMEWNMEPVTIPEILDRAIAVTSTLFQQKNLRLEKHVEEDFPFVSADKDKLIQVVVNLLSNAVKFTNKGSVTCSIYRNKDEIIVGIADTGIGIAPKDHAAVFEQFKQVGDTLTDKPKGTGLGLPICKEIIEHHGGKIWLESELGKGSAFFFSLPLIPQRATTIKPIHFDDLVRQLKQQVEQSRLNIKGKNPSVLIVDDDASIRSLLRQELGEAGYLVGEAENGNDALAYVREAHPDLIILDVMMPEMNGFDVAAILKNDPQTMDIPIIILSVVQDKSRGYRIGVDRYLTKPINTQELFAEVGSLLEQGKSHKKVMVVDEDTTTVHTLADVLHAQGYQVVESDGKELVEKAISSQPDIIILNSVLNGRHEIVQTLRFEKGLENVLFLVYQ